MFPKLKKAKLDTASLGPKMAERKQQLVEELGVGAEPTEEDRVAASLPFHE